MLSWFWKIPVFIYDFFLSTFLTIPAHIIMMNIMGKTEGIFLDVGCGTGAPLKSIIHPLKAVYDWIVGVDLHKDYTRQAQELFDKQPRVSIHNMDFYDLKNLNTKFGFIFFSFSFMLMPDPENAIKVAKDCLNKGGKISFLMTLNKKSNPILAKLKPMIKFITSVDFGNVVLESDFNRIIANSGLKQLSRVRISNRHNILLKIFPVYYVQTEIQE